MFEVDPDLAEALESRSERSALARAAGLARVDLLELGEWTGLEDYPRSAAPFGLLILDGLMARTFEVGNVCLAELLGPGDLLRPWVGLAPGSSLAMESHWSVVEEVRVAVLDQGFARRMGPYPEVAGALLDRVMMRAQWLAFHLAVARVKQLETRLLVVLWHFADRWGTVGSEGVRMPLRLTHQLLASAVGAQRPSVTTALGVLRRKRVVERRPDGSWLLLGEPPGELDRIGARAAGTPLREVDGSLDRAFS